MYSSLLSVAANVFLQITNIVHFLCYSLFLFRFFFKRQLPGIGEVYDEISHDNSPLPFWHANTVFAKIESVSNTLPASQPSE